MQRMSAIYVLQMGYLICLQYMYIHLGIRWKQIANFATNHLWSGRYHFKGYKCVGGGLNIGIGGW